MKTKGNFLVLGIFVALTFRDRRTFVHKVSFSETTHIVICDIV